MVFIYKFELIFIIIYLHNLSFRLINIVYDPIFIIFHNYSQNIIISILSHPIINSMCSLAVLIIVIAEILLTFVAHIMLIAADFISTNVTTV